MKYILNNTALISICVLNPKLLFLTPGIRSNDGWHTALLLPTDARNYNQDIHSKFD